VARVVKASVRLNDAQKIVWLEIHALESVAHRKGDWRGCYANAEVLGGRLGKPTETVERIRRELLAHGLLYKKPGRRIAFWYPAMPTYCIPTGHSADEIERCRVLLDDHIGELRPVTDDGIKQPAEESRPGTRPVTDDGHIREGRGEVPPPTPEGENTPPLSPPHELSEEERLAHQERVKKLVTGVGTETAMPPPTEQTTLPQGFRGHVFRQKVKGAA
jgi:hypothetical protein